jgi:hypothetical protein
LNARGFEFSEIHLQEALGGGWAEAYVQARIRRFANEIERVTPHEGIATC